MIKSGGASDSGRAARHTRPASIFISQAKRIGTVPLLRSKFQYDRPRHQIAVLLAENAQSIEPPENGCRAGDGRAPDKEQEPRNAGGTERDDVIVTGDARDCFELREYIAESESSAVRDTWLVPDR